MPVGAGFDAAGRPTAAADAVLAGGALGPFGGHKGSAIALMVELMGGALTGGDFGFEDRSGAFTGAQSSSAGEYLCSPARRTPIARVRSPRQSSSRRSVDVGLSDWLQALISKPS